MIHLDPRTKLYLLLLSNLLLFCHISTVLEGITMLFFIALFFLSNKVKTGIKFFFLYYTSWCIDLFLIDHMQDNIITSFIGLFAVSIRMMLPCITIGAYTFMTTTSSEMISALRKLHITESIIIPCIVMIRYFPTVKEDYHHIRDAMSLRGIGEDKKSLFLHPFNTLEYILIPLLMNSSIVAKDLTIAALTKGLSIDGKHTCLTQLKITILDFIYPLLCTIPLLLFWKGKYGL